MDLFTVFAITFAVIWCTLSISRIASGISQMERHSQRSADALELLAKIANIRRD